MTGRPREFDRSEALDKAVDMFWLQGYEATGVAELCEAMGIGRQSLYNAFGDKRSLFLEALHRYDDRLMSKAVAILEGPGSPMTNVETVLSGWETGPRGRERWGCLMANSIAEFGLADQVFGDQLAAMLGRLQSAFATAFRKAIEAAGTRTRMHSRAPS